MGQQLFNKQWRDKPQSRKVYLHRIFKNFNLPALSGDRLICKATGTFSSFIDPLFLDIKEELRSEETQVSVYHQIASGSLKHILDTLVGSYGDLAFTQDQIIEFCNQYPDLTSKTLWFLCFRDYDDNNRNDIFIANTAKCNDGLVIAYEEFSLSRFLDSKDDNYLVFPKN